MLFGASRLTPHAIRGRPFGRFARRRALRIVAISFCFFFTPSFREGLARDRIDSIIDAHELAGFGLIAYGYLRSAMLAPSFSSTVLSFLSVSPWMPSPAACVVANFSKRDMPACCGVLGPRFAGEP